MKKWLCLVLAMMLLVVSFAGCKDKETVETPKTGLEATVATVNDAVIKRGEVEEVLNAQLGYYIYMMDETQLQSYREQYLNVLIEQEVARQKAQELGYDKLTEEELAEVEKLYEDNYNYFIESFTEQLKQEDISNGVFEEEIANTDYTERAKAEVEAYFKETLYYTLERYEGETFLVKYKNYVKSNYIITEKLVPGETADVTVEESAIQAEYDSLLKSQKESYDKDITAYETADANNIQSQALYGRDATPIVYVPEGLRYVKHILVMFDEDVQTSLSEKYSAFTTAKSTYESAETDLNDAQKAVDEAADDATLATAQTELATAQTAYDSAKTAYDTAKKAYDDAVATASAGIKEKVDEVYGKVQAGEDFDSLVATYGEDPGMKSDPYKTKGYLLSAKTTGYDVAFATAGMALENVGDYSEPVYSSFGAHIIQYTSAVKAGEIPYEDAKASIEQLLLESAQSTKFGTLLTQWKGNGFEIIQYSGALSATIPEATETKTETK